VIFGGKINEVLGKSIKKGGEKLTNCKLEKLHANCKARTLSILYNKRIKIKESRA